MIMGAVQLEIEPDHNASVFVHLPMRPSFVPNRVPFDYRLQILLDWGHLVGRPFAVGLKCMGWANLGPLLPVQLSLPDASCRCSVKPNATGCSAIPAVNLSGALRKLFASPMQSRSLP